MSPKSIYISTSQKLYFLTNKDSFLLTQRQILDDEL